MDAPAETAHRPLLVGDAGKDAIKRAMSMGKPDQAIADFRAANCLEIPAADAVYALLDSLGHSRHSVHTAALDAAVHAAQKQIQSEPLPADQHSALLAQIRLYLDIPQLQHLPLQLLAKQPRLIQNDIHQKICASPRLYESCNITIKRVLWHQDFALFRQHMVPLIQAYAENDDLLWMSREIASDSAKEFTSRRRKNTALADISSAIGADLRLYMQTLGMVRERFVETNDPALGTLRLDLVMSMHDNDVSEITGDDICYGLAWPLDACIIKQLMNDQRVQELQSYFDRFDNENMPYGEISLILSSPYSRHILAGYVASILEDIAPESAVSQRYKELKFPRVLLTMGMSARDLIQQDHPKIPKDSRLRTRDFFQSLIAFIEDNSTLPTDDDISILETNDIARQVLYALLLKRAATADLDALNAWLPYIANMLPAILGIADAQLPSASSQPANPTQPAIPVPNNIAAFEVDAFVQSLSSAICGNNRAIAAILASVSRELEQSQAGSAIESTMVPVVRLLIQAGQLRHCGHVQVIAFLVGCARLLSADYNGDSAQVGQPMIANPENAVYFIFQLCEFAAAKCAVDPNHVDSLKEQYAKLALACPRQAFKYQIARSNCPHASKFLP